jgi:hypothetical protein
MSTLYISATRASARLLINIIADDHSEHTLADNKTPTVAIKVKTFSSESFIVREDLLQLLNAPINLIEYDAPDMHVLYRQFQF